MEIRTNCYHYLIETHGKITEDEAIKRLSRSPHWVWVAMEPASKLILTFDVGECTLAMAQRLVHQVTQVLAPDCAPLFLTDGFRDYLTALVTHYGQWIQPGAIKYFICYYNLTRATAAALPV